MNIWKVIDVLEEMCLNPALPHRAGCILGVGHLLCAMCIDSRTDVRAHVCSRQQQLYELWQTTDTTDSSYEVGRLRLKTKRFEGFVLCRIDRALEVS